MSTAERQVQTGDRFASSVYRDPWRLLHSSTSGTVLGVPTLFMDLVTTRALIDAAEGGAVNGWRTMGPSDGIQLAFLGAGAAGNTFNYRINAVSPIVEANASGPDAKGEPVVVAYGRMLVCSGVVTVNATTAGAAGALVSGILSTDFVGGGLTMVEPDIMVTTDVLATGVVDLTARLNEEALQAFATTVGLIPIMLHTPLLGHPYMFIETDLVSATSAKVIARRIRSKSSPAGRGL